GKHEGEAQVLADVAKRIRGHLDFGPPEASAEGAVFRELAADHFIELEKFVDVRILRGVQLIRRSEKSDPSLAQKYDLIGDAVQQIEVVRDHHAGQIELLLEPEHEHRELIA